jgi:uncharacterized protein (TIGR03083 family)
VWLTVGHDGGLTMADARKPALDRPTAMRLAATEYGRFNAMLAELKPDEWTLATNCPGWDVRAMAAHLLGMADMAASPWESRRQIKEATKRGGVFIDALTGLQVEEREELEPAHIVAQYERAGLRATKGRRRIPGLMRRRRLPATQTDGLEDWTLGYLVDVILTRDPWMHRMDIAAVTGREPELTADHDGVLVDDVVREWASRHRQPCTLTLTGPAGGSWVFGDDPSTGPELQYDAVEFCRQVGGRGETDGVLKTLVPF